MNRDGSPSQTAPGSRLPDARSGGKSPGGSGPHDRPRIRVLDGLRGWAILLVMWHHFLLDTAVGSGISARIVGVVKSGWIGVDLFFVLSGFLITNILLETREDPAYFRNFYARRSLRIFPLYYGLLFVLLVALPLILPGFRSLLGNIPEYQGWLWLYVANFAIVQYNSWEIFAGPAVRLGIFWSLAVEEHFYLVWPAVVKWCTRRLLVLVALAICAGSFVARFWIMRFGEHGYHAVGAHILTFCRADQLVIGGLAAMAVRRFGIDALQRWALAGFGLGAATILKLIYTHHMLPQSGIRACVFTYTIYAIFFASVILLAMRHAESPLVRLTLLSPVPLILGQYSYGLYVFHGLSPQLFYDWETPAFLREAGLSGVSWTFWRGGLWMLASLCMAFASWHLVEKHFLRLKRLF